MVKVQWLLEIRLKKKIVSIKLKPNLLSVCQICDQGHICIFDSKKYEIRKKNSGNLIGIVVRTSSNVYILENEKQSYMSQIDESILWHKMVGKLNFDNIVKIST